MSLGASEPAATNQKVQISQQNWFKSFVFLMKVLQFLHFLLRQYRSCSSWMGTLIPCKKALHFSTGTF